MYTCMALVYIHLDHIKCFYSFEMQTSLWWWRLQLHVLRASLVKEPCERVVLSSLVSNHQWPLIWGVQYWRWDVWLDISYSGWHCYNVWDAAMKMKWLWRFVVVVQPGIFHIPWISVCRNWSMSRTRSTVTVFLVYCVSTNECIG